MKTKTQQLYTKLTNLYQEISNSGIDETASRDDNREIFRFNHFIMLALAVNFFCIILYITRNLFLSVAINLTSATLHFASYYLNKDKKYDTAKRLSILNINIYLILLNYAEGLKAGEYMYFFPYILALTFLVKVRRFYDELASVYAVTCFSLVITFIISPFVSDLVKIPAHTYIELFNTNLALSLLLIMLFSYLILRIYKKNEDIILDEKHFGDTIYNTSLDAVFIIDSRSNVITDCNNRALEMFEAFRKGAMINSSVSSLFKETSAKQRQEIPAPFRKEGEQWQGELELITRKDNTFYGYVSIVPFEYKESFYKKLSILDITNIKLAEFELLKAKQKAESAYLAKSRFLSNMSHELRTPLNGIIGTSNLLLQEDHLNTQKLHLDVLKYSSEHMMMLINDILDYSKIEAGKIELDNSQFNLKQSVEKIVTQFTTQIGSKGLHFDVNVDKELDLDVVSDETRIRQVLSNLLSNAIKFTDKGVISFSVDMLRSASNTVTVQFTVKDTGIGIPKPKQKQIFESFTQADANTTRKYGGTGLGLAISKKLVEMLGGELLLQSEMNLGSIFHFTLDIKTSNSRKAYINTESTRKLESLKGIRILIAEDNPVNMAVAKRFLQKWDIEVGEACNGLEAVELFMHNKFDLVLLDLEMPEMDGPSAVAEMKKLNPAIPALAFTAAVYDNMYEDLRAKGFNDFIRKPFRPEDLHRKITEFVNIKV